MRNHTDKNIKKSLSQQQVINISSMISLDTKRLNSDVACSSLAVNTLIVFCSFAKQKIVFFLLGSSVGVYPNFFYFFVCFCFFVPLSFCPTRNGTTR